MYRLIICTFFAFVFSEIREEDNEVINSMVEKIAMRDYSETVNLNQFLIELKKMEFSDFKTLKSMEGSTWLKDYSEDGNNVDYMNLTLRLEKMMVKVNEVLVGPTKLSASFDIGENEMKVRAMTKGYINPGECKIKFEDFEVVKLNKVIMHSDVPEYEGLDVSNFFQDLALPLINRIVKSRWFDQYMEKMAVCFCSIAEASVDKMQDP
ncbi:uncharacterized protein LOC106662642 [Cimex lectularius]|uniref:Uncharacterized protein n=1 Tax=Cimex lectularius TaxID=79782 RepID=A0A8I6REL0_CIMLE|nr:uncharacterized protein LOC106662642 [Cimex lectularius]